MRIKKYTQFIAEAGGYLPTFVYGQGVNFAPKTVAQSLPQTHHDGQIPRHKETNAEGDVQNKLMYSELTGEYYDTFQIDDIIRRYDIWCKQNGEECDMTSISNSDELDYILSKID